MTPIVQKEEVIVHSLKKEDIAIDYRARAWCKLPYPNHLHGCPNWGMKNICPPKAPLFEKFIKPPFTLVAVKFDLEKHSKNMKEKHSKWTDKQARCVLYWQGKLDKQLGEMCEKVASNISDAIILYKPEANGVNVFKTCRKVGLILERNPQKIVWKVAIIGTKK